MQERPSGPKRQLDPNCLGPHPVHRCVIYISVYRLTKIKWCGNCGQYLSSTFMSGSTCPNCQHMFTEMVEVIGSKDSDSDSDSNKAENESENESEAEQN